MKQILVTGAYGFLGRNVAKEYKKQGNYVAGIGHGKWDKDEYSKWGIDDWYETTITFEALVNINHKFDIIVHCGGSGAVGFSWVNPFEDFQKSVQSTLFILEYIRLRNIKCKFIYPSSPAVQGNLDHIQIREEMISTPVSPYGFHKKIAEEICLSYHNNFNINIGIIRYFSIYGNGLQKQLLWDACKKIDKLDSVVFFGTGSETRDWIHVSDAVALLYAFSLKFDGYEVINGGSGIETSIKDIIEMLNKNFGKSINIEFNGVVREGDPMHFWADISKTESLNWKPLVCIEDGISEYVKYFKAIHND
jgi:UDP-glucose 4-epimerase